MHARISTTSVVFAMCGLLSLVASCSSDDSVVVDPEDASVDEVIAAAYISPQLHALDAESAGYVLLINDDGETSALKTSGMANPALTWSDHGLFFGDVHHDYLLNHDGLRVSDSPKTDYQHSMFTTAEGSVGLYNDGFTEDGYIEQVVEYDREGSTLTEVEGMYLATGMCDDQMYGIAEPTGPYADQASQEGIENDGEAGFNTLMLTQLTGTTSGVEELVAIHQVPDSDQWAFDSPCQDGILRHLATRYDDEGNTGTPVLRSWNTSTGDFNEVELRYSDGRALETTEYGFQAHGTAPLSAGENSYQWVSTATYELMETDASTGETDPIVELDGHFDATTSTLLTQFTTTHLWTLSFTHGDEAMVLRSYDRYAGDLDRMVEITDFTDHLNAEDVLSGFAVTPAQ